MRFDSFERECWAGYINYHEDNQVYHPVPNSHGPDLYI
jgi:hypothetical protein